MWLFELQHGRSHGTPCLGHQQSVHRICGRVRVGRPNLAIAASLLPKDVNLNLGLGEQLSYFLEQMQTSPIVDIAPSGDAVVTFNDIERAIGIDRPV